MEETLRCWRRRVRRMQTIDGEVDACCRNPGEGDGVDGLPERELGGLCALGVFGLERPTAKEFFEPHDSTMWIGTKLDRAGTRRTGKRDNNGNGRNFSRLGLR